MSLINNINHSTQHSVIKNIHSLPYNNKLNNFSPQIQDNTYLDSKLNIKAFTTSCTKKWVCSSSSHSLQLEKATPKQLRQLEKTLDKKAKQYSLVLDWRKSVVDLMKLLDLKSDLRTRQYLANKLGYTPNVNDTAPMNIWLHKELFNIVAKNNGRITGFLLPYKS